MVWAQIRGSTLQFKKKKKLKKKKDDDDTGGFKKEEKLREIWRGQKKDNVRYTSQEAWCFSSSTLPSAACNAQDIRLLTGTLNLLQAVRIQFHLYPATTSELFYFSRSWLARHMVIQTSCCTFPRDVCLAFLLLPSSSVTQFFSKNYVQQEQIFQIPYAIQTLEYFSIPFKNQMSSQSWGRSWKLAFFSASVIIRLNQVTK